MESYFSQLLTEVNQHLPFAISEIEWDGTLIHMGSENWKFNGFCVWAITDDNVMVMGCHEPGAESFIKGLIGQKIVGIEYSKDTPIYDPVFCLSNGLRIRFFSTIFTEPWTFRFDKEVFVASPSDRDWIIGSNQ
jgi:hypothetical protein